MKNVTLRDASEEVSFPTVSGGIETETIHQTLKFDKQDLPEIEEWEVGEKYIIVLEVKEESRHKDSDSDFAVFKVLRVGAHREELDILEAEVKEQLKI